MTFTIKLRGGRTPTIAAEYVCPLHGRFELDVQRDDGGDAPATLPCPVDGCVEASPYAISAPLGRVKRVEVQRGKWQKPERKTWMDTRELGEGMDIDEWRSKRAAIWDEKRKQDLKDL